MRAWKPLWRWLAASTGLVVLVAVAVVVFGPGKDQQPSSAPPPSTSAPRKSAAPAADEALVNRMLDQIRAGKPVEPQFATGDNPAAGVPIEAIKAKPGEQLQLGRLSIPRLHVDQPLYKVVQTTIVPQAQYVKFVLQQPADRGEKDITLFACNPITAHYQRIVVRARAT
jgi:hypothetical protein